MAGSGALLLAGLDEAGRGAVLGPLVLALVACRRDRLPALERLDLQDSKRYGSGPKARQRRSLLAGRIRDVASVVLVRSAPARMIDVWVRQRSLNELERHLARGLIQQAPGPLAELVADGSRLFGALEEEFPFLRAEDRADRANLLVAAASIVAKHERDAALERILGAYEPLFGPIQGGGYPNEATRRFLEAYRAATGKLPREVRHTWKWGPLTQQLPLFPS